MSAIALRDVKSMGCIGMGDVYKIYTVFILKTSSTRLNQNKTNWERIRVVPRQEICVLKHFTKISMGQGEQEDV
jgi:hypothetical protein